jgi:hypothetical protein
MPKLNLSLTTEVNLAELLANYCAFPYKKPLKASETKSGTRRCTLCHYFLDDPSHTQNHKPCPTFDICKYSKGKLKVRNLAISKVN